MQKEWELLYEASNIAISLDRANRILICRWFGFQHEEPTRETGALIQNFFVANKCTKLLNDNVEVIGPWYHSVEWSANTWFPAMIDAGLKHFAWVCPKDLFAQLSAQRVLPYHGFIRTFYQVDEAWEWLKSK